VPLQQLEWVNVIRATALLATIIACVILGLSAWSMYWMYLERGQDWMVFYTAARAYFDGQLSTLLDPSQFMAALNGHFETWLVKPPLSLHPWVYPPHFLLLFIPFGALPPMVSYVSFQLLTFLCLILALQLRHGQPWLWVLPSPCHRPLVLRLASAKILF
jgi:hypothetical protein